MEKKGPKWLWGKQYKIMILEHSKEEREQVTMGNTVVPCSAFFFLEQAH